jgi:transcriptional regulator with XRE-family HTH domain
MTAADFLAWRRRLGLSQAAAASALGISRNSVILYERGARADRPGVAVVIPRTVALACKAVEHRLDQV